MTADHPGSGMALLWWAAMLTAALGAGFAYALGGGPAAGALASGAGAGVAVQAPAAALLLRREKPGVSLNLRAPALSSLVRVVGGALVVLAALLWGVPAPAAFFAGFGAQYVVLEVVTDVLFVKRESRSNRAG